MSTEACGALHGARGGQGGVISSGYAPLDWQQRGRENDPRGRGTHPFRNDKVSDN